MDITAGLAADLAALTEMLGDPDLDITDTLRQLADDAKLAVGSYLGVTVLITVLGRQSSFTVLESGTGLGDIVTSVRVPMPPSDDSTVPFAVLILYAGHPGAFIDLAADLARLTGRALTEFVLDQHRTPPRAGSAPGALAAASLVDQAIGVLIARGYTLERAHREIDARAERLGVNRSGSANDILDELNGPVSEDH